MYIKYEGRNPHAYILDYYYTCICDLKKKNNVLRKGFFFLFCNLKPKPKKPYYVRIYTYVYKQDLPPRVVHGHLYFQLRSRRRVGRELISPETDFGRRPDGFNFPVYKSRICNEKYEYFSTRAISLLTFKKTKKNVLL